MIRNAFMIALRNLRQNKVFTAINILGLAIGISASLVIYLLVQYDFSFDKFHEGGDRIYRVVSNFEFSGDQFYNPGVPHPMGDAVGKEITGLEASTPFLTASSDTKVSTGGSGHTTTVFKNQEHIIFADARYFNIIRYQWLAGSPQTALSQPHQVVLTKTTAQRYFPGMTTAAIIGKELYFNDTVRTMVTGIVQDIQQHTDFTFTTFISRATLSGTSLRPGDWDNWNSTTGASQLLVKLLPGVSPKQVEKQLVTLYKKYSKPDPHVSGSTLHLLQPLQDLHFNEKYRPFDQRTAHKPTLYGLLAVAAFLLLLACINFINLTTAQSARRAREIGIRKTMGSSRKLLVFQFLGETFLLTLLATLLSALLTPLLLKVFASFVPSGLHFNIAEQPDILLFLLLLIIAVSLLAGFYPALVLSGFKPVLVLKNQAFAYSGQTRHAWLRKSLTVFQFVIAQVFIMATILVGKQISYTLNKDLGFKKDAVLYFESSFYDTSHTNKYVLLNRLRSIPEIAMVSLSTQPPSTQSFWSGPMKYKDGKKEVETNVSFKFCDTNYFRLYQLKLLAGSNLQQSDTVREFIINETYARILGFRQPQQAVGKYLEWSNKRFPITGVVADFHEKSLHEMIKPTALASWTSNERCFNVLLRSRDASSSNWKTAIQKIESNWKKIYPDNDFEYHFLDESIAGYYTAEKNISHLLAWATGLAVFISCLGLLGLVVYTTNQRTKEIGVRKVIGASVIQIISLLTRDFLKLVALAFLVAVPLAWWATHRWLQNFAYRTAISWWVFALSGTIMLLIALLVLSVKTFRAASANPVKSLRTE
jgi:predicted permease